MWRNTHVWVVDDNSQRRRELAVILEFLGKTVTESGWDGWHENQPKRGQDDEDRGAMALFLGEAPESVSLEKQLKEIRDRQDDLPVVLLDDQPLPEASAPELARMVIAIMSVPPAYNQLLDTLHRAQLYRQAQQASRRQPTRRPVHLFRSLVGTSREIQDVREMMSQVADKEVSVLITGESGTGKEVVARNLHYNSPRRDGPFVPVNCGAIPAELLESELFGHEKGAFTGAISARAGRFELAEGGTLFLDEIGDMPLNMQVKILRVLQERTYERVGSNKTLNADVRIIAATHRDLETMIAEDRFREDLFYRLNVFPIELPALKERGEDVPLLINELIARLESEERGSIRFNSAAILSLCRHPWSGNVRELANLVERMAIMQPYGVVGVQDLPPKYRHVEVAEEDFGFNAEEPAINGQAGYISMTDTPLLPEQGIDLREYISNLERELIQQALNDCGGVVARAADRLSVRRTTLVEKMRKYDLQR
ncbi:sigma-54 dependent transcriptional regulator [Marinimicrobium sp. C2-29]|uniref:sigma-54 dependent transcriptional regulator n=1 Tax=Marinimicrobium sp. C2-29 TaxID=3139825 RepID=UPI0031387EB2